MSLKVSVGILHLYSYQYNVTSAKTALILIPCQYWCITSMYMHAHHCKHICKLLRMMHYYCIIVRSSKLCTPYMLLTHKLYHIAGIVCDTQFLWRISFLPISNIVIIIFLQTLLIIKSHDLFKNRHFLHMQWHLKKDPIH